MPAKMTQKRPQKRVRCPYDIKLTAHYPEANTPDSVRDIANSMAYAGIFDNIKQE
jgi:hypothetical protein